VRVKPEIQGSQEARVQGSNDQDPLKADRKGSHRTVEQRYFYPFIGLEKIAIDDWLVISKVFAPIFP
jgi:hypothetical protein